MSEPIPGVTDGTKDDLPYTREDVVAIEAARGKPYHRLRRTVEALEFVASEHEAAMTRMQQEMADLKLSLDRQLSDKVSLENIIKSLEKRLDGPTGYRSRAEKAEAELREILTTLEGGGPVAETMFMLASRGTAKKIRELLK